MIVSSPLTRNADTTAYAANQNIGQVTTAANHSWTVDVNATTGEGYIMDARVITNKVSITPRLRLHLYSVAPTAIADAAKCTVLWANRAGYLGSITFPAMTSAADTSDTSVAELERNPKHIVLTVTATKHLPGTAKDAVIYGQLETLDAFTPSSGQIFTVVLATQASQAA